ncbi:glycosyltransferase, group 2 family protein [Thiobacillus denitrificans ATCC 25259]|uniref:Glycosyltransferase, group 2 family protein n=1 Tax=Thiobacillus denitrificans (strain ATCC 25259 / T1) TaxID=292415 RepID=Q3SIN6_THIDA|nr:glycosyltransferase family 2 protein [Thiobacillus denitrificans]AAZ97489.1 glycosyltransferase, group 2 family protein [Thiobacillus denitrificans ATCC 25259]
MPKHAYHGRLSVVVPVKNEQDNVEPLVREIAAALTGSATFEIIYVNDGSTDATQARLEALKTEFPMLRVIRHRASCGQSRAVTTGVVSARYEWIATLDGDGQNDPADIPVLLETLGDPTQPANLELIAGWRSKRRDTALRRLSSKVANAVRSRLLRDATPDTGCGLKVFARETFLQLPNFDHMHRFLPALVMRNGGAVLSVPVRHRPRERGTSKYGVHNRLWVGIVDLFGVAWLQRRVRLPLIEPDSDR